MASYQELLEDDNWRFRRKEVIVRDKMNCKYCDNNSLKEHYLETIGVLFANNEEKAAYYVKNPNGGNNPVKTFLNAKDCFLEDYPVLFQKYLVFYIPKVIDIQATNIIPNIAIRRLKQEEFTLRGKNIENIRFEPILTENMTWRTNHSLHVHHQYYQIGKLPWEYPDEALITLCWSCHEKIHLTTKIPILNEHGRQLKDLTPCHRCMGAGEFPQYRHIIHGLCFECQGGRYEEFKNDIFPIC